MQEEYYTQLEVHSSNLFAKVQRLKEGLKNSLISLVKSKKGMIPIRKKFPKVTLFYKRLIPAPPPLQLGGSKSMSIHSKLLFADESIYSKEKLSQLKTPFEAGWKREIVMRSGGCKGRKPGNVYYYSPSGVKFRSSKDVEIYLRKSTGESFTVENFTFSMVRLSFDPTKEVVREAFTGALDFGGVSHLKKEEPVSERSVLAPRMVVVEVKENSEEPEDRKRKPKSNQLEMGMLPPKYPKYMEITLNRGRPSQEKGYGFNKEEELQEDIQSLMEIVNDSLFQISAINQSRDRIELESYQRLLEQNQNQEAEKDEEVVVTDAPTPAEDSPKVEEQLETPLKDEVKELVVAPPSLNRKTSLCSIFCEGRRGQLPTLRCFKCLCLLHAECVGLPDLVCCSNFMCPNCHDAILHRNREKVEMPIQTPSKPASVPTAPSKKSVPSPPVLKPLTSETS
ncbi:Bromodomain adjacent to zinc finger domain protein 2B [Orchesella cincta]|uniref:Bromodomain adjacent to zinc finger domain protein 2B n=1 Tax=Orchesella cincta TaxID=48709 RepID=A0A1D2M397_ORCCI|nr:Bromodomain adjacent to zinc finger domain protein 2B [Orchesella cincta]